MRLREIWEQKHCWEYSKARSSFTSIVTELTKCSYRLNSLMSLGSTSAVSPRSRVIQDTRCACRTGDINLDLADWWGQTEAHDAIEENAGLLSEAGARAIIIRTHQLGFNA